jgi:UDP-N-acetylmuramate dehydrogenase
MSTMTAVQKLIQEQFGHLSPKLDESLAPITYFKIGGPAEVLLDLVTRDQIVEVAQFCQQNQIRLTLLGGASNVIVSSQGITGVVIRTINEDYQVLPEKVGDKQLVRVGAGYKTGLFVRQTIDDGFAGLEYFLGVPGRVGGAIYNNAHYLSDLVGKHIHRVEVLRPDGSTTWISQEECQFGYDDSLFQHSGDIILQAEFALAPGNKEDSMNLVKEATLYRAKTQPLGEPSSGCYFRNTPNTDQLKKSFPQYAERRECPSAFLIDQAGLKGTRVGDIEVSHKHAAFFINVGHGTSDQVRELAALVKKKVHEKFGVELREEVFFLE